MDYKSYGTIVISEESLPLLPDKSVKRFDTNLLGIPKASFYFSFYVFLYAMFLCSGAAIFSIFEAPLEIETRVKLDNAIHKFRRINQNVTDQALEDLIIEIVKADRRGVSAIRNATSSEPNWSFGQSLFFTSTVVTTIGYGHVTPLSRSGKIFCIIYAVVGIPLTLVLLSALVERFLVPTIWLLQWLNSRLGHLYQPFNIRLIHLTIIVFILVVFFLLVPAGVYASIEPEWDFLDSLYYCFISLTTIGLGDYIPGDSSDQPFRPMYKILTTAYLFLGITFMMLTLAVFYDIPQLNLGLLFTASDDNVSEKVHLATAGSGSYGSNSTYSSEHRQVVRVKSRRGDDDSPEDGGARPLGIP